jgi:hypothetical protein
VRWLSFKGKWNKYKEFLKYFEKQWVTSVFNKWRIFDCPAGYANTNSPIESFNAVIKRLFTENRRESIGAFINVMMKMIQCYSTPKPFSTEPVPSKSILAAAKKLTLADFKLNDNDRYRISDTKIIEGKTVKRNYIVCIGADKRCNCAGYIKHKICKHLLGNYFFCLYYLIRYSLNVIKTI